MIENRTEDEPKYHPGWATVPNAVTALRLFLVVPIVMLLVSGSHPVIALALVVVFASTDWLDGLLARKLGQTSRVGEIFDPVADRLGIGAVGATLAIIDVIWWWIIAVVVIADFCVLVSTLARHKRHQLRVSRIGKFRTGLILLSIASAVFGLIPGFGGLLTLGQIGVAIGALLHVVAAGGYIRQLFEGKTPYQSPAS